MLGAGIAGIAASHALTSQGIPVTLLEARDRIGGRIHDIHTEDGFPLGLGPMFLHGLGSLDNPNPLKPFLDILNIPYQAFKITDSLLVLGKEKITDFKKKQTIFQRFMRTLLEIYEIAKDRHPRLDSRHPRESGDPEKKNHTIQDIFKNIAFPNTNIAHIAKNLALAYEEAECACSLDKVGLLEWTHHHHMHEGYDLILPQSGFGKIVEKLYQEAMNTGLLKLLLNAEVTKVIHTDQETGCEVLHFEKTEKLTGFAAIICTLPLGILQSGNIHFEPQLSLEKRLALDHLEAGNMTKIVLEFENCFWENVPFISILDDVKNPSLYLFINMHHFSSGKTNTLLAFFHRDPHCVIENEENLIETALVRLKKLYPNIKNNLGLKKTTFCIWGKDRFTLGAWCSYGPLMTLADIDNLRKPENQYLFFAGEHTGISTVDSAYLSGLRAAQEVINML